MATLAQKLKTPTIQKTPVYADQSITANAAKIGRLARSVRDLEKLTSSADPKLVALKNQIRSLLTQPVYRLTVRPSSVSLTAWGVYLQALREARSAVAGVTTTAKPLLTRVQERIQATIKPPVTTSTLSPVRTSVRKPATTTIPGKTTPSIIPGVFVPAPAAIDPAFVAELAVYFRELAAEASNPDPEIYGPAKNDIAAILALPEVAPLLVATEAPVGVAADIWMDFVDALDLAQTAQDLIPVGFEPPSLTVEEGELAPVDTDGGAETTVTPPTAVEPTMLESVTAYVRENPLTVGLGTALAAVGVWQGVKYYRKRRG